MANYHYLIKEIHLVGLIILAFQLGRILDKVIPILFVVGLGANYLGLAVIPVSLLFVIGFLISFGWLAFWVWKQDADTVDAFGITGVYIAIFLVFSALLWGISWVVVFLMHLTGLSVEVWQIYLLFLFGLVRIAAHLYSPTPKDWFSDLFDMIISIISHKKRFS